MSEGEMLFGGNTKEVLKQSIERIETLERERADLAEDVKEVFVVAKSVGFDVKIMKQVIRRRKLEREERDEIDDMIKCYEDNLEEKIKELMS